MSFEVIARTPSRALRRKRTRELYTRRKAMRISRRIKEVYL